MFFEIISLFHLNRNIALIPMQSVYWLNLIIAGGWWNEVYLSLLTSMALFPYQ